MDVSFELYAKFFFKWGTVGFLGSSRVERINLPKLKNVNAHIMVRPSLTKDGYLIFESVCLPQQIEIGDKPSCLTTLSQQHFDVLIPNLVYAGCEDMGKTAISKNNIFSFCKCWCISLNKSSYCVRWSGDDLRIQLHESVHPSQPNDLNRMWVNISVIYKTFWNLKPHKHLIKMYGYRDLK